MSKQSGNNDEKKSNPSDEEGLNPTLIHEISPPKHDALSESTAAKYSSRGEPRQGGMAIVWKAYDSQLQREVAYKELRPENSGDRRFQAMFVNEAKLTGQLEHPNIVPVYEMGQADGDHRPFYTMKYLRGQTLTEAIRERRSRPITNPDPRVRFSPLLRMLLRVCDAIRYAHSRGIIHRDLKPDNVMVGDFGEVIVLDWGLAKSVAFGDGEMPAIRIGGDSHLETQAGVRKGTPAYWAPEQAQGKNDLVDHRTDIYGLGSILYQILTGQAPHARRPETSDNASGAKSVDVSEQGSPTEEIDKSVPQALISICDKAMAENRSDRYSSVAKLARDLDRWMIDEPISAHKETFVEGMLRWGRQHQVASLIAAVCMLAIVVVGGSLYSIDQVRRKQVTDQEIQSLHEFASGQGSKLTSYITSLRQDVTFLSEMQAIRSLLDSEPEPSQGPADASLLESDEANQTRADSRKSTEAAIAETFSKYLGQKFDYMQVRVLNKEGMEVVRVERNVPGAKPVIGKLSDKSGRPYFEESVKLKRGEWYLSPVELNVENGQKQPELPVVRGAVPIFQDGATESCGIVIINTHFREIVKSLDHFDSHQGAIYLTNKVGQLLYHPESELSFAFERSLDYRIQHLYPELKPEFQSAEENSSVRQARRTGMISQATSAQPAIWVRTKLRPYQSFNSTEIFQEIHDRFRNKLVSLLAENPGMQSIIGTEGETIIFGLSETELSAIASQLEADFGYPVDIDMFPAEHRGKSHAIHLNFLPLQLGKDDQALGLVLALPSDAFASHAGTGRNIFLLASALLLAVMALTFFITTRRINRLGAL